jgi:hypothetical protein
VASPAELEAWQLEAVTLAMRFEETGDPAFLRKAVGLFHRVAFDPGVGAGERAGPLSNLAKALALLAEVTGEVADLQAAVDAARAAVAAAGPADPDRGALLNDLGNVLRSLAGHAGNAGDARVLLAEAAQVAKEAIAAVPRGYDGLPAMFANLSNTLQSEFERSGDMGVLTEAVRYARGAVAAAQIGDPHEATYLIMLGEGLRTLGQRTGDVAALRDAVSTFQSLNAMAGDMDRAGIANNLSLALQVLFLRTGDTADLDGAVRELRAAVEATRPGDPDLPARLGNLGIALMQRFDRTNDAEVLQEAVVVARTAVGETPAANPLRADYLTTLSSALRMLHRVTADPAMLREAVAAARASVDATPDEDPGHLASLCETLRYSYEKTLDRASLDDAVSVGLRAVKAVTAGDPYRGYILQSLAHALWEDYERGGNPDSLTGAAHWFRESGRDEATPVSGRIAAYCRLLLLPLAPGETAADRLADAEDAGVLLPRAAPATLARPDREHGLGKLTSFAGSAAAVAVAAGRPSRAVELLEQARGILVADALDARGSDMARLRAADPGLAGQLIKARARLDVAGAGPVGDQAAVAAERREAAAAWDALVGLARQSFDPGFLRPPAVSTLTASAADGPVIYVYASALRCDALILSASADTPVQVAPLPLLTEADVARQVTRLLQATAALGDPLVPPGQPQAEIRDILRWVREAICDPTLAALGDCPMRVWWCPVGPLSYLPRHAAVLDRVVSSYAISARALAEARGRFPRGGQHSGRTLVVPVPDAPGTRFLRGVHDETAAIRDVIPDATVLPHATRDSVLREIPGYRNLHFSGHGAADLADPASGYLVLYDHATAPLTVADIAARRTDADLAFLSACETGRTSPALSNEAVHLTGAFQLAGFRHVIGTLWPVADFAASAVTRDFYREITGGGVTPPDAGRSALALHDATLRLRSEFPEDPGFWAGFTHTGP